MFRINFLVTGVLIAVIFSFCSAPQKTADIKPGSPSLSKSGETDMEVPEVSGLKKDMSATKETAASAGQAVHVVARSNSRDQNTGLTENANDDETERLQKKYSVYLGTKPESITNIKLYRFIDEWLNTPYKWGGETKSGIDCSAFVQRLLKDVYNINIKIDRTAIDQFFAKWIERFTNLDHLAEGDLIFFKTIRGRGITHVGFYCANNRFINSSSSKGVSFGNLTDYKWKKNIVAAGRIRLSKLRASGNAD